MATDGPTPPPCDPEIRADGESFLMLGQWDGGSNAIERWCLRLARETDLRIDWHFAGGRAIFYVLGDYATAREGAQRLLPEVGCGNYYRWL